MNPDPGVIVRNRIQVAWSDPDPGVMVGSGCGCHGRAGCGCHLRIRIGCYGRIRIRNHDRIMGSGSHNQIRILQFSWTDPDLESWWDPDVFVESGSGIMVIFGSEFH